MNYTSIHFSFTGLMLVLWGFASKAQTLNSQVDNAHGDNANIRMANSQALGTDKRATLWLDNDGQVKFRNVAGNGFAFRNAANTSDLIYLSNTGNIGIGTTAPGHKLTVVGSMTSVNPENTASNVSLSFLDNVARIRIGGSGEGSGNGLDIQRYSDVSLLRILGNGNVGIGTTSPQAKLAVNGNILAKEVKVKTDITVPDYVFEEGYKLPDLRELEAYVKLNKHLPEVPSAAEIGRDGLDLAAMNLLLLKKLEELTLLLIDQERKNQLMAGRMLKEINGLKKQLKSNK